MTEPTTIADRIHDVLSRYAALTTHEVWGKLTASYPRERYDQKQVSNALTRLRQAGRIQRTTDDGVNFWEAIEADATPATPAAEPATASPTPSDRADVAEPAGGAGPDAPGHSPADDDGLVQPLPASSPALPTPDRGGDTTTAVEGFIAAAYQSGYGEGLADGLEKGARPPSPMPIARALMEAERRCILDDGLTINPLNAFMSGIAAAEQHHGITRGEA